MRTVEEIYWDQARAIAIKLGPMHRGLGGLGGSLDAHRRSVPVNEEKIKSWTKTYINIAQEMDPTNRKYVGWVLREIGLGRIRTLSDVFGVVEDSSSVHSTLRHFIRIKHKLEHRDLWYYDIYTLKGVIANHIKDEKLPIPLPGPVLREVGPYVVCRLGIMQAVEVAKDTQWCTINREVARQYADAECGLYLVLRACEGGFERIAQYTGDYDQVMDTKDVPIEGTDLWNDPDFRAAIAPFETINYIPYCMEVLQGRWEEKEPEIKRLPSVAAEYAIDILNERWPEAEAAIQATPDSILQYTKVFGQIWPMPEIIQKLDPIRLARYIYYLLSSGNIETGDFELAIEKIKSSPSACVTYAYTVQRGRWPEGEPAILRSPDASFAYCSTILKHCDKVFREVIESDQNYVEPMKRIFTPDGSLTVDHANYRRY